MQTLTKKGQVTVPKSIRDYLGIAADSRVEFVVCEAGVVLRPVTESLLDFRGFLKRSRKGPPVDLKRVREQVMATVAREAAGSAKRPRRRR